MVAGQIHSCGAPRAGINGSGEAGTAGYCGRGKEEEGRVGKRDQAGHVSFGGWESITLSPEGHGVESKSQGA